MKARAPAVFLLAAFAACTGTPMPAPPTDPDLPPPPPPIEPPPPLEREGIMVEEPSPTSPGRLVVDGSAVPPDTQLSVLNLDTLDDGLLLDPGADGSFDVPIELGVLRLEAVDAWGLRSAPVDLSEGMVVLPMLECLRLPDNHNPTEGPLRVRNECADSVSAEIRLRREGAFGVTTMRLDLAVGESMDLDVSAVDGAAADALFFFVDAPIVERRAVTLY